MIELGFYVLPILIFIAALFIIYKANNAQKINMRLTVITVFWVIYVMTISKAGLLNTSYLPPRIPLLIIFPGLIIIIIGTGTKRFKSIITQLPSHLLVYVQSFRILVELLILGAFLNGIFPKQVTFEGTNFDMLAGISAIPMGYLVQKGKIGKQGILIWNVACLVLLSTAIASFMYSYYLAEVPFSSQAFVQVPYIYLAGFLAPIAIFFHVVSIRQQLMKKS